jgi:hypothetical protein
MLNRSRNSVAIADTDNAGMTLYSHHALVGHQVPETDRACRTGAQLTTPRIKWPDRRRYVVTTLFDHIPLDFMNRDSGFPVFAGHSYREVRLSDLKFRPLSSAASSRLSALMLKNTFSPTPAKTAQTVHISEVLPPTGLIAIVRQSGAPLWQVQRLNKRSMIVSTDREVVR